MNDILEIARFVVDSFLSIWPYLLITIPLAVAVNLSGASRYIGRAFQAQPLLAIVLATAVGAFSPFCSCGVIPIIASLLIGGVPLAPVMAFWVASPSMDPEIFFLSVGMLGWELALWRLLGTLLLSLGAGFITHFVMQQGWLGSEILRPRYSTEVRSTRVLLGNGWQWLKKRAAVFSWSAPSPKPALALSIPVSGRTAFAVEGASAVCGEGGEGAGETCALPRPKTMPRKLFEETTAATVMVVKFMALAFFLEALIVLYVPTEWISNTMGQGNQWAILSAALLGVPVYTSNLTALPLIGGLLGQGMNPAAALAFLIAGPTTTLPAMAAVNGLVGRRVFALYVLFALVGAIVLGYLYQAMLWWL